MIKIICIGKIKEQFFRDAILEYRKRIQKYTKLEIVELSDSSTNDITVNMRLEKEQILKHINSKDYIITLEINGNNLSSEDFASKIDKLFLYNSNITFIIGGSYGLDVEIKKLANESLSFSRLTFPHQLFRVILLEQIYRAYKIINNESYHK